MQGNWPPAANLETGASMNSKRSYLDSLNAGRERRAHVTLEQLNRSLETLEQRLEQAREENGEASVHGAPRYGRVRPYGEPAGAARRKQAPAPPPTARNPPAQAFDPAYQAIARDIERVTSQEDGIATVSRIAAELRGLREELRDQMTVGLSREFETLRRDVQQAARSAPQARDSAELAREFERLSGAIQNLAERSDDRSINLLRLDVEQVKTALETLAREESVQAVDRHWDDFHRRWDEFETRIENNGRGGAGEPGLASLGERLDQIGEAVNRLPESLPLRSLDEKLRALAGAVEHFANQQGEHGGEILAMIDERLDEISRAIVASTATAQSQLPDPEAFERIEKRIASLAHQIEEITDDRPNGEVIERLNLLSRRVDDLTNRASLPEQAMERFGQQIAAIAERIERTSAAPEANRLLEGLEQRFDLFSRMLERRHEDAAEQSGILFRDMERRLDEVADRLDRQHAPTFDSAGIMEAIDTRFKALASHLEDRQSDAAGHSAIRGLESRLEDISSRLESSAAQFAGIDPALIRSLESQVAGLSAHLSKPSTPFPEFEDISPRLEEIEKALNSTRKSVLEAAREAAENAVSALSGSGGEANAVSGLAHDLKTLEALTRRSDERNARTFEAIHDTLLKIVERLGSLENHEADRPLGDAASGKITVRDAPALDSDETLPLVSADARSFEASPRTPAEAAAEAAKAALGNDSNQKGKAAGQRKSMLGGLARAFSGRKEAAGQPAAAPIEPKAEAPAVELDGPIEPQSVEPGMLNRPLAPGSGGPDLNAIMKRVRDERTQATKPSGGEAGKSDFIAAARRAAQAAAAEAESLKKQQASTRGAAKGMRFGEMLKARRKTMLMAAGAIMLALAGLQLGKAFMSDTQQVAAQPASPAVQSAAGKTRQTANSSRNDSAKPSQQSAHAATSPGTMAASAPTIPPTSPKDTVQVEARNGTSTAASQAARTDKQAAAPQAATSQAGAPQDTQPGIAMQEKTSALPPNGSGTPSPSQAATQPQASAAGATRDVPTDVGPAALREAAANGDAKALFEIGSRYADGRGVKQDMTSAAKWYEKAANLGFAPAQYRIGNFYEKGIGVARDIGKAKTWYQMAAEQGNASAMHNLAVLFAMAADGAPDNESAARWFHAAAELGVKDSQFNLGILAAKGVGMKQNLEEAYKWFDLAAQTGDKDAAAKRDEVGKALRPEQLERARAAAKLWKAKPINAAANSADIPAAWQDAPTTTASIDMKKAVQNIQRILNKNGYAAGTDDGVMGDKTRDAIMAFQSDNDMKPTGKVDEKLVKALLARK
jgi:localization factor PodJL